ncbi:hypothetical protein BU14_0300s0014 [Porphyra umbilicalis]|uniref:Protein kinase domain-containing protein n=1 Tax=Porphyra umbilicalis TaxID=2786 RepID=A0A1X6P066_PORUM|nr:hypothetical protein BU14_0300s0014 [Porphyra umbilicalis]|eukprot:OSX74217.1 hypothetical protein BU14_0300s0014 [Porphyra umbilicalis]
MAEPSACRVRSFTWFAPDHALGRGTAVLNVDLDGAVYELTIATNRTVVVCVENAALRALLDAPPPGVQDTVALHKTKEACLRLAKDYRHLWELPAGERKAAQERASDWYIAFPVKQQLKTVDGGVVCVAPDWQVATTWMQPVDNPCGPQVPVVDKADVTPVAALGRHIAKVVLPDGSHGCLKQVYREACPPPFLREATRLAGLPPHRNIVALQGVVDSGVGDGTVDGLLLSLIEGVLLSSLTTTTAAAARMWKEQLRSALNHLHRQVPSRVWGDAKPDNIFINRVNDLVVFDFGGGHTHEWVDPNVAGTCDGDNQGYDRICQWLDSITTVTDALD